MSGASWVAGATVTLEAAGFTPFANPPSIGKQYILRRGASQVTVTVTGFTDSTHVPATLDYAAHDSLRDAATADWALAARTLGGLWHLEGKSVAILADGSVQPPAVVAGGSVAIPRASGRILAGLPYICDLETLDIERGPPTLQGRQKRVQEVVLRVKDTRGLSVGADFDRLVEIKERTTENLGVPTALTTGDERVLIDPLWQSNGRVAVRQAFPLPATVVAIVPRLEVSE